MEPTPSTVVFQIEDVGGADEVSIYNRKLREFEIRRLMYRLAPAKSTRNASAWGAIRAR
ncbi:hypothetical protein ACFL6S_35395 [Candidatus Poribacteria bacterium]